MLERKSPEIDANGECIAWFVAAAIAKIGDGAVLDQFADSEPFFSDSKELADILEDQRLNLDTTNQFYEQYPLALFHAINEGKVAYVEQALKKNASYINAYDYDKNTCLMLSLYAQNVAITKLLLKLGANVTAVNVFGYSAIDFAVRFNSEDLPELIKLGAPCFKIAAHFTSTGDCENLSRLLNAGCEVDVASPGGWTLLMLATYHGKSDVAKLLVKHGANLFAVNQDGATPLMIAADQGNLELTQMFLQKGSNPNHKSNDGSTAIVWARNGDFFDVADLIGRYLK